MACYNAVLEAWPETPFAQKLKDMPRNYDTLREPLSLFAIDMLMKHMVCRRNPYVFNAPAHDAPATNTSQSVGDAAE